MASAFHPTTGLSELDGVLHGVQPGDNIVWQIESFAMYRALVEPYAAAARREGLHLIYFRFADHPPLLDGVETYRPDPAAGFDAFVDQVHTVIEAAGRETLYVFDCLSQLADAWQSDRLLGNFFRLTCPRLLVLDTVTYFAVTRNRHSANTIARIRDTTQILVDLYHVAGQAYIHPLKVWDR